MTTADLNARMRQVLLELEVCSNGTTVAYNPAGGGGHSKKPGGERPRGGDGAPHVFWRERYAGCTGDEARQRVLREATLELEQITGRGAAAHSRPSETPEQARQAVLDGTCGWRPEDAARSAAARGISPRTLRRWRREANLDPEDGAPQGKWSHLSGMAARQKARDLVHRHGYSLRDAGRELGVDSTQISRWTNKRTDMEEAA